MIKVKKFNTRLIEWHDEHGRKDLPWQIKKNPYKVWISEIMLQQTQVITVIPYFNKFLERFPNIKSLAESDQEEIMSYWSGLGYYSRARNLYKASQKILCKHDAKLPNSFNELIALPGIGKTTAGAILALGFKKKAAILDGNVKRVLARHQKIESDISKSLTIKNLWEQAELLLPKKRIDTYTQSLMDLGATICKNNLPLCEICPISEDCLAFNENKVDSLPIKKLPKNKPTRYVHWLIPVSPNGKILLQKRKDEGLWGGLWAFMENEKENELKRECELKFKMNNPVLKTLHAVKHSFSHYNLKAFPYIVKIKENKKFKNTIWVDSKNIESLGMPSPVKETIKKIRIS